jgi:hypothetical protein
MSTGGKHTITPGGGGTPDGPKFGIFHLIFCLFLLYGLLKSCTGDSSPPDHPQPQPPTSKVATIDAGGLLKVVLEGGSYEFIYYTEDSLSDVKDKYKGSNTFTANFQNGRVSGDISSAQVLIIVGNVNLHVADIYNTDELNARISSTYDKTKAYFKYSRSQRGPPDPQKRVLIIIVGIMEKINIGKSFNRSTRDIEIMDLDPSEDEWKKYNGDISRYEDRVRERMSRPEFTREFSHGRPAPR